MSTLTPQRFCELMPQVRYADYLRATADEPIRRVSNEAWREALATGTRRQAVKERRNVIVWEREREWNEVFTALQELPDKALVGLGKARRRLFKAKSLC